MRESDMFVSSMTHSAKGVAMSTTIDLPAVKNTSVSNGTMKQKPASRQAPHRESARSSASACQKTRAGPSLPLAPTSESPPEPPSGAVAHPEPPLPLNDSVIAAMNRQASVIGNMFFPGQVIGSLSLGDQTSITSVRIFLARFREEANGTGDPVEKLLLDQLIVAHLKVGELYAHSAGVQDLGFKQMYNNAAVRLLSTICQLVSTLSAYRATLSPHSNRCTDPSSKARRDGKKT